MKSSILYLILISFFLISCGVKGDPKPPFEPAVLNKAELKVKNQNTKSQNKKEEENEKL